jgi:hypothetical protein
MPVVTERQITSAHRTALGASCSGLQRVITEAKGSGYESVVASTDRCHFQFFQSSSREGTVTARPVVIAALLNMSAAYSSPSAT